MTSISSRLNGLRAAMIGDKTSFASWCFLHRLKILSYCSSTLFGSWSSTPPRTLDLGTHYARNLFLMWPPRFRIASSPDCAHLNITVIPLCSCCLTRSYCLVKVFGLQNFGSFRRADSLPASLRAGITWAIILCTSICEPPVPAVLDKDDEWRWQGLSRGETNPFWGEILSQDQERVHD